MKATQFYAAKAKAMRKAFVLLGVYALHLVFLQVLMQAAPEHNIDHTFKPLFTHKDHQKKQNPQPPNHPAVTYYTMLMKQGKDVSRVCNTVAPTVNETEICSGHYDFKLSIISHVYQAGLTQLHVADDTFKLYRLIQVFLI